MICRRTWAKAEASCSTNRRHWLALCALMSLIAYVIYLPTLEHQRHQVAVVAAQADQDSEMPRREEGDHSTRQQSSISSGRLQLLGRDARVPTDAVIGKVRESGGHVVGAVAPSLLMNRTSRTSLSLSDFIAISKSLTFLPNYKNPCWKEPLPSENPYRSNTYQTRTSFKNLTEQWRSRREKGHTWRLRCLPYFYIVGAAKCGTTDLYNKLAQHPDIVPGPMKEPQWWGMGRLQIEPRRAIPFQDYVDLFDEPARHIMEGEDGRYHQKIAGDASAVTLVYNDKWKSQPENANLTEPKYVNAHYMHILQPAAKIIIILREPASRLFSSYLFYSRFDGHHNNVSLDDFHHRAKVAIAFMQECVQLRGIRSCLYDEELNKPHLHIRVGMYYAYLRDWLDVFPRDQVYVVRFEDYAEGTVPVLNGVLRYLGVSSLSPELVTTIENNTIYNARTAANSLLGDMLDETRDLLDDFYRPYNKMLADLLGDNRYLWQWKKSAGLV